MASLTGQQINTTYEGLIKTLDNAATTGTPKTLTDGLGNALPIQVGASGVNFPSGTVNFTGATVTGLTVPPGATGATGPQGAAGLAGATGATGTSGAQGFTGATGLGSTGATGAQGGSGAQGFTGATGAGLTGATGPQGFTGATGLGSTGATGAQGNQGNIGATGAQGPAGGATTPPLIPGATGTLDTIQSAAYLTPNIGSAEASGNYALAIGAGAKARAGSVALGPTAIVHAPSTGGIAIRDGNVFGSRGISIGYNGCFTDAIQIGFNGVAENQGVALGINTYALTDSVAIGRQARTINGSDRQIAIGYYPVAGAYGSIAIGSQAQTGISSDYGIAIGFNASTGVSGNQGFSAGYQAFAGDANTIAIGSFATATETNNIAIGRQAVATGDPQATAIGFSSTANQPYAVALGASASATASGAVALGTVTAAVANYTTTQNFQLTNYAALNYANDAAAAAGGVPLGGVYHNAGAARIRIV